MPDRPIVCADCGGEFAFTERDQAFYAERGFEPPKRCKECREKRKRNKEREQGRY